MLSELFQPSEYHKTFLSKEELISIVEQKVSPIDVAQIISAYEMSASVHEEQIRRDGSPYFYHCTRVCKLLLDELYIFDVNVLCASLLHDVLEDSDDITAEVLRYNFGDEVANMVRILTKDLERRLLSPEKVDAEHLETLRSAPEECLIIRLAARLDNFRCLDFDLKRSPIKYLNTTLQHYIPLAELYPDSVPLRTLVKRLRQESNRYLG